jgi:phosphoribosylformimino-5-aminoimidazole carboxamide ribotide isomerase
MEIIPAVDILNGKCVRLVRGDFATETVYHDDPVAAARRWRDEGATRLHIVDLDGAREGSPQHLHIVEAIVKAVRIPVQLGGGLRSIESLQAAFDVGVDRCIISTAAAKKPKLVQQIFKQFGDRIILGLDAYEGRVAIRGWQYRTRETIEDFALRMQMIGAKRVIFTDIGVEGMLGGASFETTRALARALKIPVIASGGVATLEDVRRLAELEADGVDGVIIGKALYAGTIKLKDAIQAAKSPKPAGAKKVAKAPKPLRFTVLVERAEDGTYVATIPQLPGCVAAGSSIVEVEARAREAIAKALPSAEKKAAIPQRVFTGVYVIEVER